MNVHYYYKRFTKKVPARIFIFYGSWPQRNIEAGRGHMLFMLSREATQLEREAGYLDGFRMEYCQYQDWEKLLADETLMQVPAEHVAALEAHRAYCPLGGSKKKK